MATSHRHRVAVARRSWVLSVVDAPVAVDPAGTRRPRDRRARHVRRRRRARKLWTWFSDRRPRQIECRHPRRRPGRDDAVRRHHHLAAGAHLLHRATWTATAATPTTSPPCQPVHRVDAHAGHRRQHAADPVGWELDGPVLVHAHRPLVGGARPTPTPPSRRSSPPAPVTSACSSASSPCSSPPARASTSPTSTQRALERRHQPHAVLVAARSPCSSASIGKSAPVPAAHLAARRHGRPDAGVGADPRRHHGRGRRVPGRPLLRRVLVGLLDRRTARLNPIAVDRRHHDHHRRRPRVRAGRHQEGARLLHRQPARATWSWPSASARGPAASSTSSPTPSSRPACSSAPVR